MYFSFVIPFLLAVSGQECDQCEVRSKSLLQAALKAQRQDDLDLSQAYGIPRHDLTNLRVPLHTEIQTTNMGQANQFQDHIERLGENHINVTIRRCWFRKVANKNPPFGRFSQTLVNNGDFNDQLPSVVMS